jgi:hypothetical protein
MSPLARGAPSHNQADRATGGGRIGLHPAYQTTLPVGSMPARDGVAGPAQIFR